MAYDHGYREYFFTATAGSPDILASATTVRRYANLPIFGKSVVRAVAWRGLSTKVMGSGVFSIRLATAAGAAAASGSQIDTLTLGTGTGRGKVFYIKGPNTTVSGGSQLQAVVTTSATGALGHLVAFVETSPPDPGTNAQAAESA